MPRPKGLWLRIASTRLLDMNPDLKPYDLYRILMVDLTTVSRVYKEIRKKPLRVSFEEMAPSHSLSLYPYQVELCEFLYIVSQHPVLESFRINPFI